MSRYLVLLVLTWPLFALAQEATEADGEAVDLPPVDPCAAVAQDAEAEGADPARGEEGAAGENGDAASGPPVAEDCERAESADSPPVADAIGAEGTQADGEPENAAESDAEGDEDESDPDEEDFRPSEEISEDYPVPLPSDI